MFWVGIAFLVNWLINYSFGNYEDSWLFACILIIWGWDGRPRWKTLKKVGERIWVRLRYKYIIILESRTETAGFYPPIYEWLIKNIGQKNVWLQRTGTDVILHNTFTNTFTFKSTYTYEFKFKRKKDAMAFKLVWS